MADGSVNTKLPSGKYLNIYLERKYVEINKFISAPLVDKRKARKKSSELTGNPLSYEHQIALVTDVMAKCNDFGMVKESKIGQSAAKPLYYKLDEYDILLDHIQEWNVQRLFQ